MQRQSLVPVIRSNFYVFAVLAYTGILVFNYLKAGVLFQFTYGILALVVLPVVLYILHKTRKTDQQLFLKQWVPFIVILLSYEALQGTTGSTISLKNIVNLYPIDKMFWSINVTGTVQRMFYSQAMTDVMLVFYSLHFYLVILASVVLWLFRRTLFTRYVIAITITSYVSLMIFAIYPTAPPWFSNVALNLASASSNSVHAAPPILSQIASLSNLIEADKFAAFPSLHAAYVTLFAAYMVKFRKKLIVLMIPLEFGVLFATLYLGQHYLIDLVAGVSLALTSVYLADIITGKYKISFFSKRDLNKQVTEIS